MAAHDVRHRTDGGSASGRVPGGGRLKRVPDALCRTLVAPGCVRILAPTCPCACGLAACRCAAERSVRDRGVAQLAEQRSPKPQVAGSSPVTPASTQETRAGLGTTGTRTRRRERGVGPVTAEARRERWSDRPGAARTPRGRAGAARGAARAPPPTVRGRRSRPGRPTGDKGRRTRSRDGRPPGRRSRCPSGSVRFLREVVAELRKVIWPTRKRADHLHDRRPRLRGVHGRTGRGAGPAVRPGRDAPCSADADTTGAGTPATRKRDAVTELRGTDHRAAPVRRRRALARSSSDLARRWPRPTDVESAADRSRPHRRRRRRRRRDRRRDATAADDADDAADAERRRRRRRRRRATLDDGRRRRCADAETTPTMSPRATRTTDGRGRRGRPGRGDARRAAARARRLVRRALLRRLREQGEDQPRDPDPDPGRGGLHLPGRGAHRRGHRDQERAAQAGPAQGAARLHPRAHGPQRRSRGAPCATPRASPASSAPPRGRRR